MLATCKVFDTICLKAIRDTILSTMWSNVGQGNSIFEWGWYPIEGESFFFELAERHTHTRARARANKHTHTHTQTRTHTQTHARTHAIPSLVEHVGLRLRKTLIRVLGLLIIMILMRVRKSIFFQSNTFTG